MMSFSLVALQELDRSNVRQCLQEVRRGRYEKLARGNDGDLFVGRFAGRGGGGKQMHCLLWMAVLALLAFQGKLGCQ